MKRDFFCLISSKPFDFGGHCTSCRRQTEEIVAVDVSKRKDLALVIAEMVVHPLILLNQKSVRIPFCNTCRFSLWMLRLCCSLVFLGLLTLIVWVISDKNPQLKNSDVGMYLFVFGVFGVVLIPFVYTAIKEFIVGAEVSLQKNGELCYRFRTARIPEFLERRGLCKKSSEDKQVWVVIPQD